MSFEDSLTALIEQAVRRVVREEFNACIAPYIDKAVTTAEAAAMLGVSTQTIKNMERRGEIRNINGGRGHGRYSMNQIKQLKCKSH